MGLITRACQNNCYVDIYVNHLGGDYLLGNQPY
jgi:hypothetical protein